MPSKRVSPAARRRIRLRRSSVRTGTTRYSARRSWPTVAGRDSAMASTLHRPPEATAPTRSRPGGGAARCPRARHRRNVGRGWILAEMEMHQRGEEGGCAPPLVAEGLALHVVHRVGVGAGVGAAEHAGEVKLVAPQGGAGIAEDAISGDAQFAITGVAEARLEGDVQGQEGCHVVDAAVAGVKAARAVEEPAAFGVDGQTVGVAAWGS